MLEEAGMLLNEFGGPKNRDITITTSRKQMGIAAENQCNASGNGAGEELVIVRIVADRLRQLPRVHACAVGGQKCQDWLRVDAWSFLGQVLRDGKEASC